MSEQCLPSAGSTRLGAHKGMGSYVKPIAGSAEEAALKRSRSRGATGMVLKVCTAWRTRYPDLTPMCRFFFNCGCSPYYINSDRWPSSTQTLRIHVQTLEEAIQSQLQCATWTSDRTLPLTSRGWILFKVDL